MTAVMESISGIEKPVQMLPENELPLARIYANERDRAAQPYFTQPYDGGKLKHWTWAEAMGEARRMAAWIIAKNYPPGSRIAIYSRNCAWWIMADYAIWMAGHTSTPFFSVVREASLIGLFEHAEPVACFIGALDAPLPQHSVFDKLDFISLPSAAPAHIPSSATSWDSIIASQPPLEGNPTRKYDDLATIIYTSGTTGVPKGVMHTFQSLMLMAVAQEPVLLHNPPALDRAISYLPLAHVSERSLTEMNSILFPIHVFFTEGLETFVTDLKRAQATIFTSVPRLYMRFQQGVWAKMPQKKLNLLLSIPILKNIIAKKILAGLGFDKLRVSSSGSAAITVEVIHWYRRLGLNFVEGYGMTEIGISHVPVPNEYRIGYVGTAAPFAHTRISADGEVQVKGPMNMVGYFRNPELTAQSFTEDGYFHTGDRGEIDDMNRLRLVGRMKEEFKTAKGKYVAPAQIEKLLSISPLLESAAVFGSGLTAPFAMTVLTPDQRAACSNAEARAAMEPQLISVLQSVNADLEAHEHMRFMVVCQHPWTSDNGFLTPTLKVRRPFIEAKYGDSFAQWDATAGASSEQCAIVWLDAL